MTNEELSARIQGGDTDLLLQLWQQVERFAWQQARRAADTPEDRADCYQSGFVALVKAAKTYRVDAGKSFIGWFAFYLRNEFAAVGGYRTRDPLRHAASLDAPVGEDGATLGDLLPSQNDALQDIIQQAEQDGLYAALHNAVDALPDAERSVIVQRFWDGLTLEEIASRRGCGRERVRQIEAAALRRIRHPANNREIRAWLRE